MPHCGCSALDGVNNVITYQKGLHFKGIQVHYFHKHNAYKHILAEIHSNLSIN